jgi:metal-responsive CopG/Arc/MetJ family transcriptional regulator
MVMGESGWADKPNMVAEQKMRISLTLSSDVLKGIDHLAAKANVSRSAYIEAVLRQYLRDRDASRMRK